MMPMLKQMWDWYKQYPAFWTFQFLGLIGVPFKWRLWPLPWCGAGYCANSFSEYRAFIRARGE